MDHKKLFAGRLRQKFTKLILNLLMLIFLHELLLIQLHLLLHFEISFHILHSLRIYIAFVEVIVRRWGVDDHVLQAELASMCLVVALETSELVVLVRSFLQLLVWVVELV